MTIPFATSNIAGANFSTVYTPPASTALDYQAIVPPAALGTIAFGTDGSAWIYCAVGTGGITDLGYVVVIDEDFLAVMMSNSVGAKGDAIGVAPAAASLADRIWIQRFGTCDAIAAIASTAANTSLASTTTAGVIDDATGSLTKNLSDIYLTTARGGTDGTAPGFLNWPTVGTTN